MSQAKDIFLDVRELPEAERELFLVEACGGDDQLRAEVDALLVADGCVADVLGTTVEAVGQGLISEASRSGAMSAALHGDLQLGDRVGPFLLEEELGVGGFGVVFRASQERPVRRQVALKVIKLGMDTLSVMARFELERQSLALMNHPNIAQVFDAGATEAGRPYFVMELVEGVPITEYCRGEGLSLSETLRLFVLVCQAVQHAHQRGVLHRDLKPSNVLVATVDGQAQPKVIDFGIAKAIGDEGLDGPFGDLGSGTPATREGLLLGTPDAMSPEQARGVPDIDTRADVYSLGVLLYELLCGERPFDGRGMGLAELLNTIQEKDPLRPSVRSGQAQAGASELDWVAMCCLEKDRDRRYASASELAADVERFLSDEPLRAAPPSTRYRMRKLLQRHRAAALAVGGIVLALLVGGVGTAVGLIRAEGLNTRLSASLEETREANRQLDQALAERSRVNLQLDLALVEARTQADIAQAVNDFLSEDLLGAARPTGGVMQGPDMPIRDLVDVAAAELDRVSLPGGRFEQRPLVEAALRYTLGTTYDTLGSYEESARHMARCVELRREHLGPSQLSTLEALSFLGTTRLRLGQWAQSLEDQRAAYGGLMESVGLESVTTLASAARLSSALRRNGQVQEALQLLTEALPVARRVLGERAPVSTDLGSALGVLNADLGRFDVAADLFRDVLEVQQDLLGAQSPVTLNTKTHLATSLRALGNHERSLQLYLEAIEVQRAVEGETHPNVLNTLFNILECLRSMNRLQEAEAIVLKALPAVEQAYGREHPNTLLWWSSRGGLAAQQGDGTAAEAAYRVVHERSLLALGKNHPMRVANSWALAGLLHGMGRGPEGHALYVETHQGLVAEHGAKYPMSMEGALLVGVSLRVLGDFEAAEVQLLQVHEEAVQSSDETHPVAQEAAASLSVIESQRDAPEQAARWMESAMLLQGSTNGRARGSWAGAMQQLVLAWRRAGDEPAAREWEARLR